MITNTTISTPSYQQVSIDRQKEDNNQVREILNKESPIENNVSNVNNELTRKDTVNEVDNISAKETINKNQEINKEVIEERNNIQKGTISAESSLGQNIDIKA